MSTIVVAMLAVLVFVTSAISGVFGMAGGMILMAALLFLMPVPAAMAIHATIQTASNGWRCWLWRRHIVWRALPFYAAGVVVGFATVAAVTFVPDRATALIVMGALPLMSLAARRYVNISITRRFHAFAAAIILTFIQMTAGVVGPLLDVLYNNAPLTRQQIISTKAFTQTAMHLLRLVYYAAFLPLAAVPFTWPDGVGAGAMAFFIAASIAGTSAAALVLRRMHDDTFKAASRYIIAVIGMFCLGQGVYLMWQG